MKIPLSIRRKGLCHEPIQHAVSPSFPRPFAGNARTTERCGLGSWRSVCRAGSNARPTFGTSCNTPRAEGTDRGVPAAHGLDRRESSARADREIPVSNSTMDGCTVEPCEPEATDLSTRSSSAREAASRICRLLGLGGQLGPDQVPVVRAKVSAGDGSFAEPLNGYAVLDRHRPSTRYPVVYRPSRDTEITRQLGLSSSRDTSNMHIGHRLNLA